jgi:hypothetical protein
MAMLFGGCMQPDTVPTADPQSHPDQYAVLCVDCGYEEVFSLDDRHALDARDIHRFETGMRRDCLDKFHAVRVFRSTFNSRARKHQTFSWWELWRFDDVDLREPGVRRN